MDSVRRLCNYLQNVVATTYIFVLQLPTFLFYNKHDEKLRTLRLSKYAYIFVRKVKEEHGVTLPFTYVGIGALTNERIQEKVDSETGKDNITYLYDIPMKDELPEYLRYDFGVAQ